MAPRRSALGRGPVAAAAAVLVTAACGGSTIASTDTARDGSLQPDSTAAEVKPEVSSEVSDQRMEAATDGDVGAETQDAAGDGAEVAQDAFVLDDGPESTGCVNRCVIYRTPPPMLNLA